MTTETPLTATSAPLRLPAILQNPQNRAQKQVEAHNAQQREKIVARREKERVEGSSLAGRGRGKRFVRRKDNAAFLSNPHISPPTRSDLYPSVPLHLRPNGPSFPPSVLDRSVPIPSVEIEPRDPYSKSSINGAFSTSLKGTRAMLRKRGRRVEVLVGKVEEEIKGWLKGEGFFENTRAEVESSGWRVVDGSLVEVQLPKVDLADQPESASMSTGNGRRMPDRHRLREALPPLPPVEQAGTLSAILEYSRSPAHLSWAVMDGFERLVLHLVARYYELVTWSEDHPTTSGELIRLTHIIRPNLIRPPQPSTSANGLLPTPDNSDLSAPPSSDSEVHTDTDRDLTSISESETRGGSASDSATEVGTEAADSDLEGFAQSDGEGEGDLDGGVGDETITQEGYSVDVDPAQSHSHAQAHPETMASLTLSAAMDELHLNSTRIHTHGHGQHNSNTPHLGPGLQRTHSNSSTSTSSSWYASSEGESEGGMSDSFMLPAMPRPPTATSAADPNGGWISVSFDEFNRGAGAGYGDEYETTTSSGIPLPRHAGLPPLPSMISGSKSPRRGTELRDVKSRRGAEEKPSFFEYLYGE